MNQNQRTRTSCSLLNNHSWHQPPSTTATWPSNWRSQVWWRGLTSWSLLRWRWVSSLRTWEPLTISIMPLWSHRRLWIILMRRMLLKVWLKSISIKRVFIEIRIRFTPRALWNQTFTNEYITMKRSRTSRWEWGFTILPRKLRSRSPRM